MGLSYRCVFRGVYSVVHSCRPRAAKFRLCVFYVVAFKGFIVSERAVTKVDNGIISKGFVSSLLDERIQNNPR